MAHDCSFQCEDIAELQAVVHALLKSRSVLFQRGRGDPDAALDFIGGQSVILSALQFLSATPDSNDMIMNELIRSVWRRYRIGPILGTGQACQYLLNYLYEKYEDDHRIEWPGWKKLNW